MLLWQIHEVDGVLSRKPCVTIGGKNSLWHNADAFLSGQAGFQLLCALDAYWNARPMKCQKEADRLDRPALRKAGHHQIEALLIPVHDAVDVGAVTAPAHLPGVAFSGLSVTA